MIYNRYMKCENYLFKDTIVEIWNELKLHASENKINRLNDIAHFSMECDIIKEIGVHQGLSLIPMIITKPKKLIAIDQDFKFFRNKKRPNCNLFEELDIQYDAMLTELLWLLNTDLGECREKDIDNWLTGFKVLYYDKGIENKIRRYCRTYEIEFEMYECDSLHQKCVSKVDLLHLDGDHSLNRVAQELELHAPLVNKYIIFHDTISCNLIPTIDEYMKNAYEKWKVVIDYKKGNGHRIIERL